MSILNVNIVTERLDGEAFDLAIATNVLIYYDILEQALALSNIEAMLKSGAFLLANFSAPNLTSVTLKPVETTTTRFTRTPDGKEDILDFMVWYRARGN
jgi:chemotaxis methyl-accepting protein methylase